MASQVCGWCGGPAHTKVVVAPPVTRKVPRQAPVMVKRAIEADVCPEHAEMVRRETLRAEREHLEKKRHRTTAENEHLNELRSEATS